MPIVQMRKLEHWQAKQFGKSSLLANKGIGGWTWPVLLLAPSSSPSPHHTVSHHTFQHEAGFEIIGAFCHLLFFGNPKCWSDSVAKQEFKIVKKVAPGKELSCPDYDQWRLSTMGNGQTPTENVNNSEQLEREQHAEEACFEKIGGQCFISAVMSLQDPSQWVPSNIHIGLFVVWC